MILDEWMFEVDRLTLTQKFSYKVQAIHMTMDVVQIQLLGYAIQLCRILRLWITRRFLWKEGRNKVSYYTSLERNSS